MCVGTFTDWKNCELSAGYMAEEQRTIHVGDYELTGTNEYLLKFFNVKERFDRLSSIKFEDFVDQSSKLKQSPPSLQQLTLDHLTKRCVYFHDDHYVNEKGDLSLLDPLPSLLRELVRKNTDEHCTSFHWRVTDLIDQILKEYWYWDEVLLFS